MLFRLEELHIERRLGPREATQAVGGRHAGRAWTKVPVTPGELVRRRRVLELTDGGAAVRPNSYARIVCGKPISSSIWACRGSCSRSGRAPHGAFYRRPPAGADRRRPERCSKGPPRPRDPWRAVAIETGEFDFAGPRGDQIVHLAPDARPRHAADRGEGIVQI